MPTKRDFLNRITEPRSYMRLPSMVKLATILAAISFFSGCMESPRDGQVVRSLGEEMTGRLIATEEGSEMTLSARTSRGWVDLVSDTTTRGDATPFDGSTYYVKSVDFTIPSSARLRGKTGHYAHLKGTVQTAGDEEWSMLTYKAGCRITNTREATNCQSDNQGAYIFTRDFPRQSDLVLRDIRPASRGIRVEVWNGGREVTLDRISCSTYGFSVALTVDREMTPGSTIVEDLALPIVTGHEIECLATGTQPDGRPDPGIRAEPGDNRRVEIL